VGAQEQQVPQANKVRGVKDGLVLLVKQVQQDKQDQRVLLVKKEIEAIQVSQVQ